MGHKVSLFPFTCSVKQMLIQYMHGHDRYHGAFLKRSHLWIVMEYCAGGSCADLASPVLRCLWNIPRLTRWCTARKGWTVP